jgi:hypothetical protein
MSNGILEHLVSENQIFFSLFFSFLFLYFFYSISIHLFIFSFLSFVFSNLDHLYHSFISHSFFTHLFLSFSYIFSFFFLLIFLLIFSLLLHIYFWRRENDGTRESNLIFFLSSFFFVCWFYYRMLYSQKINCSFIFVIVETIKVILFLNQSNSFSSYNLGVTQSNHN